MDVKKVNSPGKSVCGEEGGKGLEERSLFVTRPSLDGLLLDEARVVSDVLGSIEYFTIYDMTSWNQALLSANRLCR